MRRFRSSYSTSSSFSIYLSVQFREMTFEMQEYNSEMRNIYNYILPLFILDKGCRTQELSAALTVTRAYWRKQNPPVCGEILRVFRKKLVWRQA